MTTQRSATVSVVIPYFNAASTVERAIRSVASDNAVIEVIVADDGSSDDGRSVVAAIGNKVRFLEGRNGGAPSARNRGMAAARGDYVLFLDADDYLDTGYIDCLAKLIGDEVDIVIGPYKRMSIDGELLDIATYSPDTPSDAVLALYLTNPVQTGALLWHIPLLVRLGGWDEGLAIYQDAELAMRALLRNPHVKIAETGGRFAYWLDNESSTRLSNKFTEKKATSTLYALNKHKDAILQTKNSANIEGVALRYYSLARLSAKNGHREISNQALAAFRELGFKGHPGSLVHKFGCSLIGLRGKVVLADWLSRRFAS